MSLGRHGFTIGIERLDNDFFLSLKAVGKLTHEDYQYMTPLIESALEGVKCHKIKVLLDITELQGWELRAAWDDFKLGLKYGQEFERSAIVGNKTWQEYSARVASWFISGEVKYFLDEAEALAWLSD